MGFCFVMLTQKEIDFFWKNVNKTDGCWIWTGSVNRDGYGTMSVSKRTTGAHKVSYIMAYGVEPNHNVCHTCDNPGCVRPDHLFDGTQKENIQDSIQKGRFRFVPKISIQGSLNGKAKLDEHKVKEIREKYSSGNFTQQELADEYGVARPTIGNIVREDGFHWAWLR